MKRANLLIALLVCVWGAAAFGATGKPNIVFILADDLGINDLSCYGRKEHPTPNLDRLAGQGMRFTSAYAAQPICSPTRAALITGKAPARLHITTFLPGRPDAVSQVLLHPKIEQQLPLTEPSIARMLKPEGYATACIGKWHLGGAGFGPAEHGFDFVFAGHAVTKPSVAEGGKGENELTDKAVQFIEENKGRPFFLYLSHNSPHVPLGAKQELIAKYKDAWNPVYAAMMETLDDSVGRIMAKLDALGLSERTLFIFTSDHGGLHVPELPETPATYNAPYRAGKGYLYEGGLRVPLIVRWPGKVKEGALEATPVISTDWVPTWIEAAGASAPGPLDGVSLIGLLAGGTPPANRPLFWHFPHYTNQGGRPAGAVREGDLKLIEHYEDGRLELFDLSKDPGETTDVAMVQAGKVAELRGKLEAWRREVGAQENTPNPHFDAALWKQLYQDTDTSRLAVGANAAETREKLASWRTTMDRVVKPGAAPVEGREVIRLPGSAAVVHGEKLRYEPLPQKCTLGFWVKPEDWAEWKFTVATAGKFEVQILQGCGKGSGGAEVDFIFDEQTLGVKVQETGHFQNFIPRNVGTVTLTPGEHTLMVRPRTKPGGAVMDLRQVTLLPALP